MLALNHQRRRAYSLQQICTIPPHYFMMRCMDFVDVVAAPLSIRRNHIQGWLVLAQRFLVSYKKYKIVP